MVPIFDRINQYFGCLFTVHNTDAPGCYSHVVNNVRNPLFGIDIFEEILTNRIYDSSQ